MNNMPVRLKDKNKAKPPFYPDSPSSVGSPWKDGFRKRTVRQRTPRKLCSLVLPPPLMSLFDDSGVINDATPTTSASMVERAPPPHRYPSSNASVVSTSIASVCGGIPRVDHLPQHFRVGMTQCDPLSVFDGRFVLVATCDGRIAIFSIFDFDTRSGISEDVEASERRRRLEWMEEDNIVEKGYNQNSTRADANNAHQHPHPSVHAEDEEHEWDVRDRMRHREDAKQNVEPILVLSLPRGSNLTRDDKKIAGKFATPPTIVAMCATPSGGASLIEIRDIVDPTSIIDAADGQFEAIPPSSNDELVGHVAVLTSEGDVHVVEFRDSSSRSNDSQGSDEGRICANETNFKRTPLVDFVLSFNTTCLEATCISMYPVLASDNKGGRCHHPVLLFSPQIPSIRLCIGHQSGLLAAYQIFSLRTHFRTPPKGNFIEKDVHRRSPTANNTAAYVTDIEAVDLCNSGSNIVDPRVSFHNDLIPLQRTRSEHIAVSDDVQSGKTPIVSSPTAELCWMGKFDVPICSLSSSGWGWLSNEESNIALLVVGTECRGNSLHQVSMNGIGPSVSHHSLSPAISLEVLNATLAEILWSKMSTGLNGKGNKCISLHDCSVWPSPGKEIKDGWLRGSSRRGMDTRDKLFATLGLKKTSITSKICQYELIALVSALALQ
jgi:hypothetical protein